MKYIVKEIDGLEIPILFSDFISHTYMNDRIYGKLLSAGFVYFDNLNGIYTEGRSTSLRIDSRHGDADLIKKYLNRDKY